MSVAAVPFWEDSPQFVPDALCAECRSTTALVLEPDGRYRCREEHRIGNELRRAGAVMAEYRPFYEPRRGR